MAVFVKRKRYTPPSKSSYRSRYSELSTDKLSISLSAETLGTFNRSTKSTVDDQLRKNTQGTGDTEQNSVVVGFVQAIVLQEDTGVLEAR